MKPIAINLINKCEYCPLQAKNAIDGLPFESELLRAGSDKHEEAQRMKRVIDTHGLLEHVKNSLKKRHTKKSSRTSSGTVLQTIREKNSRLFSEVWVSSKMHQIEGSCDEVEIKDGEVTIIEYKCTEKTPSNDQFAKQYTSALRQVQAYAQAFLEYYDIKRINIAIKRVNLNDINNHQDRGDLQFRKEEGGEKIIASGWTGHIREILRRPYDPETDFEEVKEIINTIRTGSFESRNNLAQCKSCIYMHTCEASLVK